MQLKNFPLAWRWTDPKYVVLPDEILNEIEPQEKNKAAALFEAGVKFCGNDGLDERQFEIEQLETHTTNTEAVSEWLLRLHPEANTKVWLSWQPDTAVSTTWEIFPSIGANFATRLQTICWFGQKTTLGLSSIIMKTYPTLLAMLLISISTTAMSESPKTKTLETPSGPVTTTTEIIQPTPQKVSVASPKQVAVINSLASKAKSFVSTYLPGVSNPSLKNLDDAFHRWQRDKNRNYTDQQVIEMLGAYLGNQLITDLQMEWVVVTDQYGTDYAVRAKKMEVMSFPFSSVSKRIESNQYDFMAGVYEAVKHTIATGDSKPR